MALPEQGVISSSPSPISQSVMEVIKIRPTHSTLSGWWVGGTDPIISIEKTTGHLALYVDLTNLKTLEPW